MPYINRSRPSHHDRDARAYAREKAESLEAQHDAFIAYMHEQRMDEATIERELHRYEEILAVRRTAAIQDTR